MAEDEDQGHLDRLADAAGVCYAPSHPGEEHEEGEQVGECRVWPVVRVLGLYRSSDDQYLLGNIRQ